MASTFQVTRSTLIDAPASAIYPLIEDFRNWTQWSPWEKLDPEMDRVYEGAQTGVGAIHSWSGNRKVGSGRMEITSATAPSEVVVDLQFLKPFKAQNVATYSLAEVEGGTEVTWKMTGPMTLVTKIMGIFKSMDKMVGPDFEEGLANLKRVAEQS